MLEILRKHIKKAKRFHYQYSGKSSGMIDSYLSESQAHDEIMSKRLLDRETITIFDVGACECLDSVRYRQLFPASTVHSFEASPKNIARAKEVLERYNCGNIVLNSVAVSDAEGEVDFFSSDGAPEKKMNDRNWDYGNKSGSILAPDIDKIQTVWSWLKFRKSEIVLCTTLSTYCQENGINKIDLLHLDVQGAELKVLEGAIPILHQIESIWVEVSSEKFYFDQVLATDLHRFLVSHGYSRELQSGDGPQWDELWCR